MKIVIIEDEIRIREGIVNLILRVNKAHEIIGQAEDGKEGLAIIRKKKPDLVITDIRMSEMDGLEMLQRLKEERISVKAIILSAYTEFSYARQAVKLGVNEYLLKPIAVGEFTQSLKNVENQLEQERQLQVNHPEMLRSLENVFYSIMLSGMPINEEMCQFLSCVYQIDADGTFIILLNYLGENYEQNKEKMKRILTPLLKQKADCQNYFLELPKNNALLIVLYSFKDYIKIERCFQNIILPQIHRQITFHACFGWIAFQNLSNFKKSLDQIQKYMDWNIVLEDDVMISYPKVTKIQTVPLSYPINIESQMRAALCAMDDHEIKKGIQAFENYFKQGNIYSPKEIKDSFIRFLWNIINVSKEIDFKRYQELEQPEYLEKIIAAITWQELKETLDSMMKLLDTNDMYKDISTSFMVQRAKSLIHEFYSQGVTLDEIATRLKITPEYLSTQFHKEVGINFSSYIKKYRIQKAKELLLGTDLKLYQVAGKIGYSDPKHFSKVFREIAGEMPAEYRRLHK